MFTPKQESPIMLEDETVHIGTQKSRVYCSLPRKKRLLLWAFGQQKVECDVNDEQMHRPLLLKDSTRPRSSATRHPWAAVVTGPPRPAAQLSSSCGRLRSAKVESLGR